MPEIRHQQSGGSPEIASSEIHIPNESDPGTGTFTTQFKAKAFARGKEIASMMVNAPVFQISATVSASGRVTVVLGKAQPEHYATFLLPAAFDRAAKHTIRIEFAGWKIGAAYADDEKLRRDAATTEH